VIGGDETTPELIELQGAARIDGKPFVILLIDGEQKGQLTPAEAVAHGTRAIQAAIEAERDAGFVEFWREEMGRSEEETSALILGMREHRSQSDPDPSRSVRPGKAHGEGA
jgi:hypothetical protein